MANPELTKRVIEGIRKSGFPLELRVASILQKMGWAASIGNFYRDFETDIVRECDISGSKKINGVSIRLTIECKKSTDSQIVLYAPQNRKMMPFISQWLKIFPKLSFQGDAPYIEKTVVDQLSSLPLLDASVPLAKTLIVTKG